MKDQGERSKAEVEHVSLDDMVYKNKNIKGYRIPTSNDNES